jgi:Protein of unknown function (DUF3489)
VPAPDASNQEESTMAKIKSSTKSNTARKAAKNAKRRARAERAAEKPENVAGTDSAPQTKQALVLGLLQRNEGASVAELVEATGWLPHTTRAALTRLRQGGHELKKERRETGETAYRIAPARTTRSRKAA